MLAYDSPQIASLLIAVAVAYVLGALPLADRVSRRRGVDIFNTGTGLAGASNVLRYVGKLPAAIVFLGDMAKGIIAVFFAQQFLGIEGPWIVIPAASAVMGHWNSIFSGFKGGDGLVTLGGVTLIVFPEYGIIGVVFACLVSLAAQKMRYTSLVNILSGYAVIVVLALKFYSDDVDTAFAMGALAIVVFAHAVFGHARRRRSEDDDVAPDLAGQQEAG